jgi:ABC-type multidrug transport system fused ATPase/permease subunit
MTKMSWLYIRLLMVAAFLVSTIGASFSVLGLAKLFSGAPVSVAIMAASLEFAKLVTTGFLYRYWGHIPYVMRAYLSFAVCVLVSITSMGIFGYLSNAYQQSSMHFHEQQLQLATMETDNKRIEDQINEMQKFVTNIPNTYITRKLQMQRETAEDIRKLRENSNKILADISTLKLSMLDVQAKIGPIIYVARYVGADPESCVNLLILLFTIVFDPLAVCLVFALNLSIRLREKYRGQEAKISAHALSTPVDHRYKKAA